MSSQSLLLSWLNKPSSLNRGEAPAFWPSLWFSSGLTQTAPHPPCVGGLRLACSALDGASWGQSKRETSFNWLLHFFWCKPGCRWLSGLTLSAHSELFSNQHHQVLLLMSAFNPFSACICAWHYSENKQINSIKSVFHCYLKKNIRLIISYFKNPTRYLCSMSVISQSFQTDMAFDILSCLSVFISIGFISV